MNIENFSLDNARLIFDLTDFRKELNSFIKGKINNHPLCIDLHKVSYDKSKPIYNKDYTLVAEMFEENICENWKEKKQYGNSGFDSNS